MGRPKETEKVMCDSASPIKLSYMYLDIQMDESIAQGKEEVTSLPL